MILVLSGSRESQGIIAELVRNNFQLKVLVTGREGRGISPGETVIIESGLDRESLTELFAKDNFNAVVDLTHPSASKASAVIQELCSLSKVKYIRYVREETSLPDHPLVHQVYSWQEAAAVAVTLGKTCFLTTGSNNLEVFLTDEVRKRCRVVVRVLPDHRIIKKCQDMGIDPKDIVAMQGPFSRELNKAIFKAYRSNVVVTKDSGKAGGTDTKISAALTLKIPVIVIKRSRSSEFAEFSSFTELKPFLTN